MKSRKFLGDNVFEDLIDHKQEKENNKPNNQDIFEPGETFFESLLTSCYKLEGYIDYYQYQ